MDFDFPRYCALLLCIAVRRSELGQQPELLPLCPQQLVEVFAEDPVQLLMQFDDLDLGLQIDLIIQAGGQTVGRRLAVLGHQDEAVQAIGATRHIAKYVQDPPNEAT
jgi:hypothetical protein